MWYTLNKGFLHFMRRTVDSCTWIVQISAALWHFLLQNTLPNYKKKIVFTVKKISTGFKILISIFWNLFLSLSTYVSFFLSLCLSLSLSLFLSLSLSFSLSLPMFLSFSLYVSLSLSLSFSLFLSLSTYVSFFLSLCLSLSLSSSQDREVLFSILTGLDCPDPQAWL